MNEEKQKMYFVLSSIGNPIMREGDEANPYKFYDLRSAFQFAEKELKKSLEDSISIVEINVIERLMCENSESNL